MSMRHKRIGKLPVMLRQQRGVVLFIALIALVTIMLAAVALVRSVDTSSLIAGNISFRRAATSSADSGLENAITLLKAKQLADQGKNPDTDATHALNVSQATEGYYANISTALDFFDDATWTDAKSSDAQDDVSDNSRRFIIQRMCDGDGVPKKEECVFSDAEFDTDSQDKLTPEKSSISVMYRVTVRVTGPRNTVSYVQGFIY